MKAMVAVLVPRLCLIDLDSFVIFFIVCPL
jgi:hypothetical protein